MSGRLRPDTPVTGCSDSAVDAWTDVIVCWCTMESLPSRTGEIVVLRVAGDVDLATLSVLEWALASSIARQPMHLVVDLAGLEFCSARGMSMLFRAGVTARERGFGYAISNVPPHLDRIWQTLWPDELPPRYRNVGTAVTAIEHPTGHRLTVLDGDAACCAGSGSLPSEGAV